MHARGNVLCTLIPHALIIISIRPKLPSVLSLIDSLDQNAWLEHFLRSMNLPRQEHSRCVSSRALVSSFASSNKNVVCMCILPFILWVVASWPRPILPCWWVLKTYVLYAKFSKILIMPLGFLIFFMYPHVLKFCLIPLSFLKFVVCRCFLFSLSESLF